jgi:hypothetical protein
MTRQISPDDLDAVVARALGRLGKAAKSQDPLAAQEIIKDLIRSQLELAASSEHRDRLSEIGDDTVALCRYMGELGAADAVVRRKLGRAMTEDERSAYVAGADARMLEARALELGQARRGGKVLDWMLRGAS